MQVILGRFFSRVVSMFLLFTFLFVWAEEQTILIGATLGQDVDYKADWSWSSPASLIDGGFKSTFEKTDLDIFLNSDGRKEMKIILTKK